MSITLRYGTTHIAMSQELPPDRSEHKSERQQLAPLRAIARIAIVAGAAGSLSLMLVAGQSAPLILQLLFALWVPAPFIAAWFAHMGSWRWPEDTLPLVYFLVVIATVVTLALYAFATFGPPRDRPAPFFVAIPVMLWLLLGAGFMLTGGGHPKR
jgi:cation transport ATPase